MTADLAEHLAIDRHEVLRPRREIHQQIVCVGELVDASHRRKLARAFVSDRVPASLDKVAGIQDLVGTDRVVDIDLKLANCRFNCRRCPRML